jgi:hypothetical protein
VDEVSLSRRELAQAKRQLQQALGEKTQLAQQVLAFRAAAHSELSARTNPASNLPVRAGARAPPSHATDELEELRRLQTANAALERAYSQVCRECRIQIYCGINICAFYF